MSKETKISPVLAVEKGKEVEAFPIKQGPEGKEEIIAYKVNGVMIPLKEFEEKYDLK